MKTRMLSWTHQPEILGSLELSLGSEALGGGGDSEADGPCVLSSPPGGPWVMGERPAVTWGIRWLSETPLAHSTGLALGGGCLGKTALCSLEQVGGPP